MRFRLLSLGLAALLLGAGGGCEFMKRQGRPTPVAPAGGELAERPAAEFVAYLNRQAALVKTIRYDDLSLRASQDGSDLPRLNEGTIACAPPRNFRLMSGHTFSSGEIDIGSNPSEFWMYAKRGDPKYVFCSHDDFASGRANLPIPFDPNWVLEALGLQQYDPAENYTVELDPRNGVYTLTSEGRSARGEPQKKLTVFAGRQVTADQPQVLKHVVIGADGRPIAVAEVREVKTVEAGGGSVQVPTRVVLEWPPQKFRMDLSLSKVSVNQPMSGEETAFFFSKPRIQGANPINLAGAEFRPSSYRGQAPEAGPAYRRRGLFGGR